MSDQERGDEPVDEIGSAPPAAAGPAPDGSQSGPGGSPPSADDWSIAPGRAPRSRALVAGVAVVVVLVLAVGATAALGWQGKGPLSRLGSHALTKPDTLLGVPHTTDQKLIRDEATQSAKAKQSFGGDEVMVAYYSPQGSPVPALIVQASRGRHPDKDLAAFAAAGGETRTVGKSTCYGISGAWVCERVGDHLTVAAGAVNDGSPTRAAKAVDAIWAAQ